MANNIAVQYKLGIDTVLNGTIALRITDEEGNYSYWVPEEDVVEHAIDGNLIGYLDRTEINPKSNKKRFIGDHLGRTEIENIDRIKRIRTNHRDGGFKYWVRYEREAEESGE